MGLSVTPQKVDTILMDMVEDKIRFTFQMFVKVRELGTSLLVQLPNTVNSIPKQPKDSLKEKVRDV